MVRHNRSTRLPRTGDVLLAQEDDWVLVSRSRDGQSGNWYLVYHRHDDMLAGGGFVNNLSPMMSLINAEGKAIGYRCMHCQAPIHEGLEFLQKMLLWEQEQ